MARTRSKVAGPLTVVVAALVGLGPGCGGKTTGAGPSGGSSGGGSGSGSADGGPAPWSTLRSTAIDKVDLLFVVDNSASMGDKQAYLAQSAPTLIARLVQPNCIDASGNVVGQSDSQGNGTCVQGTVEFPPVYDMHIGVLSTSLGTRLSNQYGGGSGTVCDPDATLTTSGGATFPTHNDDRAELLARTNPLDMSGDPLADAGQLHYLSWFPAVAKNEGSVPPPVAITNTATLVSDFESLIHGVGYYGCGIESQLESWYRFLVQPDPYDSLALDGSGHAQWVGVDTTILAQRAAFLRPDSLVAIIDVTDENDSEIDVRSIGGQGYSWMAGNFDPWMGTPGCAEDANDDGLTDPAACTSCGYAAQSCPTPDQYTDANDWGFNLNLRHVHMTQKYGVWPQFPIQRYVQGLTSLRIPDRSGEYPAGATSYQGLTNCTNPLFAAELPDGSQTDAATLCNLQPGPRTPDLVYYAHIGGVPHQLLQSTPGQGTCPAGTAPADCPPKPVLTSSDWTKILGNDPLNFDYTGIDPHMLESYAPRPGIPAAPSAADAEGVADWITDQGSQHTLDVDREYACTFPLATPRDCTDVTDPTVSYACDCPSTTGLTPAELPPICDPTTQTQQVAAKAYPTQRELLLANLLGNQGYVSSLCPIHVVPAAGETITTDPLYGYNPALDGIVGRLKISLVGQCLPEQLAADPSGAVPCTVLVQLPAASAPGACENPGSACDPARGLYGPGVTPPGASGPAMTQQALDSFCQSEEAQYSGASGGPADPSTFPVCALAQLTPGADPGDFTNGSCAVSPSPGWCYVTGAAANGCPQAILFSTGEPPAGATLALQCAGQ